VLGRWGVALKENKTVSSLTTWCYTNVIFIKKNQSLTYGNRDMKQRIEYNYDSFNRVLLSFQSYTIYTSE
jgi:hypothetical protein